MGADARGSPGEGSKATVNDTHKCYSEKGKTKHTLCRTWRGNVLRLGVCTVDTVRMLAAQKHLSALLLPH